VDHDYEIITFSRLDLRSRIRDLHGVLWLISKSKRKIPFKDQRVYILSKLHILPPLRDVNALRVSERALSESFYMCH